MFTEVALRADTVVCGENGCAWLLILATGVSHQIGRNGLTPQNEMGVGNMKMKTTMIALVASVALCTQSFGFEALDRMLGMVFDKPTCCDGKSSQKSGASQKGGCARHGCQKSRCGCVLRLKRG